MAKRIAAVLGGVLLGIAIAFARAGAFPFWNSDSGSSKPQQPAAQSAQAPALTASSAPAPANAPEPNERGMVVSSFAPLVKRIMPTVVNVAVTQKVKGFGLGNQPEEEGGGGDGGGDEPGPPGQFGGPGGENPYDFFRHFFGEMPHEFKQHGLGSGVIVSPDGYILTNNHVVGGAEEIQVTLMDKREFMAKVIGKDPKTDLALIKINTKDALPAATLGDSDSAQVGDWAIAIGNPFGFSLTVTAGIVSAKGRILGGNYDDFLQTDASINPGNSGGPLFNEHGQVIGINSVIYSNTGQNNGIGFAIPIDLAKNVMEQLKEHGRVVRGWLGVQIQEVTADLANSFGLAKPQGALVAKVEKDSPAEKAGIKGGDVILTYNGKPLEDEHELPALVAQTPLNKTVDIGLIRDGKHESVPVTIVELKEEQVASARSEEGGADWGMQVAPITPELASRLNLQSDKGVVIRGVRPDSPAADAGVQQNDVIVELNHNKIATVDDFMAQAQQAKKDKKPALLRVQRGSAYLYTVIKPAQPEGQG